MEKQICFLKSLEDQGEISEKVKNDLYPSGSKPGVLYGLTKIHKTLKDGMQSFWPILSAIETPISKLAKLYNQLLKPLTYNESTVKDSFSFAKEVSKTFTSYGKFWYKITFDQHTSNRNVKPLWTKPSHKSSRS